MGIKKFNWSCLSSLLKKKSFWFFLSFFSLYFLDWQVFLDFDQSIIEIQILFDLLRTGLGLLLFTIPGIIIFRSVYQDSRLGSAISIGFSLSFLIVDILGLIARAGHLSFDFVRFGFITITGISGLIFFGYLSSGGESNRKAGKENELVWVLFLLVPIVCSALVALKPTFSLNNGDDLTYLAYLTRWQHSDGMAFQEMFYGTQYREPARFLFSLIPMGWAMVAEFSGLHGILLLDGYFQFFLPIISIIGLYELARSLKFSVKISLISVLIHIISFMVLFDPNFQPGNIFFTLLDQDKAVAAFLIVPAFFLVTIRYLNNHSMKNLLFFLLVGISLSLAHPIILIYTLIIIGVWCVLGLYPEKKYKELIAVVCLAIILMLPHLYSMVIDRNIESVRPYTLEAAESYDYFHEIATVIEGTPFYGFNPNMFKIRKIMGFEVIQLNFFLRWIFLLFAIPMTIFGAINFRKSLSARFILGNMFLLAMAGIPYTGWLLGYIVTPRMLWRVPWLYPFGIGIVFVFHQTISIFTSLKNKKSFVPFFRSDKLALFLLCGLSLVTIILVIPGWLKTFTSYRIELSEIKQLLTVGEVLEQSIPEDSIGAAPEPYNSVLPGLVSHWNVISYRGGAPISINYFLTTNEKLIRKRAINDLFSADVSSQRKLKLLRQYKVSYVFYPLEMEKDFFLKTQYPKCFKPTASTSDFGVYQVIPNECFK